MKYMSNNDNPIRLVLVSNFFINIIDKKNCIVSLKANGTAYWLKLHNVKKIMEIYTVINRGNENEIYAIKTRLAKEVLLRNDVFCDEIDFL